MVAFFASELSFSSSFLAVISDESQDISTTEQLSISFRYIRDDFTIQESFLGFYATVSTTGEAIASLITDAMMRFSFSGEKLRGQAYDGGSNMSGKHIGAQAKIKAKFPKAIYVRCYNHCLNLALQDTARKCSWIRDALDLVHGVFTFIKDSPKRKGMLMDHQDGYASLKPISQTRWTVRYVSLQKFEQQYVSILATLKEISSDKKNSTAAATASGYANQMRKMEEFFAVALAKDMFQMTDRVAELLQKPTITIFAAKEHIDTLRSSLLHLKENCFQRNWNHALSFAKENDLTMPKEARPITLPAKLGGPGAGK